jgi:RNA polymerase sigma-70 factor (ECF subfamily)
MRVNEQGMLVERLRQRDPDALARVFEMQSDKIYRLAVSILRDEQQADGVVQDTFLKLIEAIDGFEGRSRLDTWLYRVAYNECLGRMRRAKPDVSLDDFLDGDFMPDNFVSWEQVPDDDLRSEEAQREMQAAISTLPSILSAVFTLRDIEGLSTRETATILGISESAVKVRLHRARLLLREKLADYFQEWVRT